LPVARCLLEGWHAISSNGGNIAMYPSATYRLQLHHQFRLKHLRAIIDYLETLGIDTIYASPIFAAVPGSLHGYDVTNSDLINPEIGTESEWEEISKYLQQKNIGWLQDIVPNHMAFDSGNERLMDVLERGKFSAYARFFDINWNHHEAELKGKILVPFLGEELEQCINKEDIQLQFDEQGFSIQYFETKWPVSISAYRLLMPKIQESSHTSEAGLRLLGQLNELAERAQSGISNKEWRSVKETWLIEASNHPVTRELILEKC
jgi:(1->4)-alpha-D-glucan 1-alpha-D-glucosylmutase